VRAGEVYKESFVDAVEVLYPHRASKKGNSEPQHFSKPTTLQKLTDRPTTNQSIKMITISILYPSNASFDMDYYLSKHMQLVDSKFRPHGLTRWSVSKLSEGPHSIHTQLLFDNKEGFETAFSEDGDEIQGDVKNFCDEKPTRFVGEVVGSSSL